MPKVLPEAVRAGDEHERGGDFDRVVDAFLNVQKGARQLEGFGQLPGVYVVQAEFLRECVGVTEKFEVVW